MKTSSLQFKWIFTTVYEENWAAAPHTHSYHEMVLVLQGGMEVDCFGLERTKSRGKYPVAPEDYDTSATQELIMRCALEGMLPPRKKIAKPKQTFSAEPGDILLYPSGLIHSDACTRDVTLSNYCMHFVWPDLPENFPVLLRDQHGRIRTLMKWLIDETRAWNTMSPDLCTQLLQTVISQLHRIWLFREDELLRTVRRYVRNHASEPILLDTLADEAGMSKYHFIRRFKEATGRTPMEEVRRMRADYARELVMTSDRPLKEIAPMAGFSDEYHMSRLFKRYFGSTPGSLR